MLRIFSGETRHFANVWHHVGSRGRLRGARGHSSFQGYKRYTCKAVKPNAIYTKRAGPWSASGISIVTMQCSLYITTCVISMDPLSIIGHMPACEVSPGDENKPMWVVFSDYSGAAHVKTPRTEPDL